jgi:hypothetical protein
MRRCLARGVFVVAVILSFSPLYAEQPPTEELLRRWHESNSFCRGGNGDETLAWCIVRDGYGDVLSIRNWCYGKEGETGYQMRWHECGPDSNKPEAVSPEEIE